MTDKTKYCSKTFQKHLYKMIIIIASKCYCIVCSAKPFDGFHFLSQLLTQALSIWSKKNSKEEEEDISVIDYFCAEVYVCFSHKEFVCVCVCVSIWSRRSTVRFIESTFFRCCSKRLVVVFFEFHRSNSARVHRSESGTRRVLWLDSWPNVCLCALSCCCWLEIGLRRM